MAQDNYTTNRKKGKHLTLIERAKIEIYLKERRTITEIAKLIDVSRRTIQREIKRGMVSRLLNPDLSTYDAYSSEKSHNKYLYNKKMKQGYLKIGKNRKLAEFIEKSIITEKNSPYVALEKAKKQGIDVNICLKTLYNYINSDLFINIVKGAICYKKSKKKQGNLKKSIRKMGGKSIEERSEIINNRVEVGHMEMDTVVGARGTSECLLVLTDRKTRLEIIRKLKSKSIEEVRKAILEIVREYPKLIKTITSDNGSEFMDAKFIESLGIEYFYAHSYCSYERGSNENNNKLIRRHIPKGTNIELISDEKIKEIEDWINNYPRKLFNGKSALDVFFENFKNIF